MKIFLVRHGEKELSEEDVSLTKEGFIQAKAVAKQLMKYKISKVYSSDLLRAKQTANEYVLLSQQKIIETSKLREIYRVLVGGPERENTSKNRLKEDKQRADEIFDEFLTVNENIVVFCHGNIIKYFLNKILKSNEDIWTKMTINTCSISIINFENKLLGIETINLIEHLPNKVWTVEIEKIEIKKVKKNTQKSFDFWYPKN